MEIFDEKISTRIDLSRVYTDDDFETKWLKDKNRLPRTFRETATELWVQLIPKDAIVHTGDKVIEFSRDLMAEIIEVFSRYINPIPIDFDHNSEFAKMRGQQTDIAGYCTGVAIKDDEFYARYLLNAGAVDGIKTGKCAFSSPTLAFNAIDRKTGKRNRVEMTKIALTPDPAIDGQEAINLSRESKEMFEKKEPGLENKPEEKTAGEVPSKDAPPPPQTTNPLQKLAEAAGIPVESLGQIIDERLDAIVAVLKGETSLSAGCAGMSDAQKAAIAIAKEKKGELTNMSNTPEKGDDKIVFLTDKIAALTKENEELKAKQAQAEQLEFSRKLDAKMIELIAGGMLKEREELARKYYTRAWDEADAFFKGIKDVPVGESQAGPDPTGEPTTYAMLSGNQKYKFDTMRRSGSYGTLRDEELIKELLTLESAGA